jgi:hypothetical protein
MLGVKVHVQLSSLKIIDFLSAVYDTVSVGGAPMAMMIGDGTPMDLTYVFFFAGIDLRLAVQNCATSTAG